MQNRKLSIDLRPAAKLLVDAVIKKPLVIDKMKFEQTLLIEALAHLERTNDITTFNRYQELLKEHPSLEGKPAPDNTLKFKRTVLSEAINASETSWLLFHNYFLEDFRRKLSSSQLCGEPWYVSVGYYGQLSSYRFNPHTYETLNQLFGNQYWFEPDFHTDIDISFYGRTVNEVRGNTPLASNLGYYHSLVGYEDPREIIECLECDDIAIRSYGWESCAKYLSCLLALTTSINASMNNCLPNEQDQNNTLSSQQLLFALFSLLLISACAMRYSPRLFSQNKKPIGIDEVNTTELDHSPFQAKRK